MASARITGQPRYSLELSFNEAITLESILSMVGGDDKLSLRKHASAITDALQSVGIHDEYCELSTQLFRDCDEIIAIDVPDEYQKYLA